MSSGNSADASGIGDSSPNQSSRNSEEFPLDVEKVISVNGGFKKNGEEQDPSPGPSHKQENADTDSNENTDLLDPRQYDENIFLVTFSKGDKENPQNWSLRKKSLHTAFYGLTTFAAQFNSAVMSPTVPHLMDSFGISREVAILGTSLYVLGIAFGPSVFAPYSEMNGRKMGVMLPFFISLIFTAGTASSDNISAILCTRFFAGFFAGAPVVSSGGVLADIWDPAIRGVALIFYAVFVTAGVTFGSILSSVVTSGSDTDWRWSCWLIVIIGGVILFFDVILLSETYAPVILAKRASNLRINTHQWAYHAKHDEWKLDLKEFLTLHLLRPFAMFATPIVFCIAMFASFVFGVLYLVITSVPITFQITKGWEGTVATLPMVALFLGLITGSGLNVWSGLRYAKLVRANNNKPLPEQRFPVMMMFGWLMPAGTFIFAWTLRPEIHWIVPMIGIYLLGTGFIVIFQGCLNYLVDTFTRFAASAIAANTFVRSIFGGIFPLFGDTMFINLGVNWGGSLVGFIALALTPIPYIFYLYGEKLRSRNPYSKLVS
ncbi:Tpo1p [Sugiyamaella lignohabitans]|uniref:Tpo1p n=1 Tax=Sugiyamaella lignohabitans TaxID=796027 RepID=A0A167ETU3_9ASCO|nr:Tpo1p [Sugiyamaella lignohabitans]ANB14444.1 Tpo1p [Sugiyamaella lignohabitans]